MFECIVIASWMLAIVWGCISLVSGYICIHSGYRITLGAVSLIISLISGLYCIAFLISYVPDLSHVFVLPCIQVIS